MRGRDRLYPLEAAGLAAVCFVLLSGLWAGKRQERLADRMVRLHVVAASDSAADQAAKLAVRDRVLDILAPALEDAEDAAGAREILRDALPALEELAAETAGTTARASLARESFPTRSYGSFSLPAGEYVSLRIVLGEGAGRNWWCVVYPPLCAVAGEIRPAGALGKDDVRLITEDGAGYELRFRVMEWWGALRSAWEKDEPAPREPEEIAGSPRPGAGFRES